jgi:hypothetical protein
MGRGLSTPRDLAERVHARIGPARADDADLAAGERAQRVDDQALHGRRAPGWTCQP